MATTRKQLAENSGEQRRGRPFRKGQSGNPGGRPKVAAEIRDLAQQHGPDAVKKLVALMKSAAREDVQVRAAEALLDRGYGRPGQALELTGKDGGPLTCTEKREWHLELLTKDEIVIFRRLVQKATRRVPTAPQGGEDCGHA